MPKLATIERDVNLSDLTMHFADDSFPAESGGPGALVVQTRDDSLPPMILPASSPAVQALVAELTGKVSASAQAQAQARRAR